MTPTKPQTLRRDPYSRPVHPGKILREDVLSRLGLSIADAAEKTGISLTDLTAILDETRSITAQDADRIGALCGNGPGPWLRMQAAHDSWQPPAHDFRHAAMHTLADWPVLCRIAVRHTKAKRLDSRAVAILYARATDADRQSMSIEEKTFANAALAAYPA